jgi:YD repeat-containing protein
MDRTGLSRRSLILIAARALKRATLGGKSVAKGLAAAALLFVALPLVVITGIGVPPALATGNGSGAVTFSETGANQSWTVPTGITSILAVVYGASGGGTYAGEGSEIIATLPVTAGQTLTLVVGGEGTHDCGCAGFNGGGSAYYYAGTGGGASDIRIGGTALSNRVVVAGGGGGEAQGYDSSSLGYGGNGGGTTAQVGGNANSCTATGGGGGTATAGGAGGTGGNGSGYAGTLGVGGEGNPGGAWSGGGGGGGYYGGGGGAECNGGWSGGGGGGGSDYIEPSATNVQDSPGVNIGNGSVTIYYGGAVPATTLNGGANESAPQLRVCKTADAVICATGDYTETYDELSIPGRGVPLDFSLTYNSISASQSSPVGFGWTDPYNINLVVNTTAGTATVTQENGSTVVFTQNGTNWQPPSYVPATLVQNQNGTYTFQRLEGQNSYVFSSSGSLQTITDLNGYATTLAYNQSGQLTTVTDPASRTLQFSYGSNGLVSQITDPLSRTVGLGYDASNDLASITDPAGRITSFTYNTTTHLLLTATPPNGQTGGPDQGADIVNTYDATGRVLTQIDPAGLETRFSYVANTTTVTDPHGNVTTEQFADGEPLVVTQASGTASPSTWLYRYDAQTLATVAVTDPDDHTTSYTVDANGNRLSETDPLNNTTSYSYNSLNELLSVQDPIGIETAYTYDAHGNILTKTVTGTGGSPVETTSYSYGDSFPGDM